MSQLIDRSQVLLPRFGSTTVIASPNGIVRLEFDGAETPPNGEVGSVIDSISQRACAQLLAYFNHERTSFDLPFDLLDLPTFQQEVLRLTSTIPFGETRTYGDLAHILGSGSDARAVGVALATNPIPILIPCHRVISADGKLRGYSGPGGLETKAWLLQLEGARLIA